MSTAAPARADPETANRIASSATSSVAQLVQRLSVEVNAAEQRVYRLQADAAKVFAGRPSEYLD